MILTNDKCRSYCHVLCKLAHVYEKKIKIISIIVDSSILYMRIDGYKSYRNYAENERLNDTFSNKMQYCRIYNHGRANITQID